MKINGKTGKDFRDFRPRVRAVFFQNRVLHLGVVHIGHEDWMVLSTCGDEQVFHRLRTGFVTEVGDEREAVEHLSGHGAPRVPVPVSCARPTPQSTTWPTAFASRCRARA